MKEILMETTFYDVSIFHILIIVILSGVGYSMLFFYLINTYVKVNNVYVRKKVIDITKEINETIDPLIGDKKFLDHVNTSMNTVINFKAINYNVDIVTISLDKSNNTVSIITSNYNKTIVLGNKIGRSEISYIEDELLKRIPKGE